jgi:hypothetical protein
VYHWPEEDDLALIFQQTEEFQRISFGRSPFVTARTLPITGHHHVIQPETHVAHGTKKINKKHETIFFFFFFFFSFWLNKSQRDPGTNTTELDPATKQTIDFFFFFNFKF